MVAANVDEIFKDRPASENGMKLTDIFNINILIDMKRELIMLFGSWGLYLGARKINDYLDRCEEEEKEKLREEEAAGESQQPDEPKKTK